MTKAADFTFKYPPEYVPDKNITVYRVPMELGEGTIPNAEDDGYSVYVSDELTDEEALKKALHGYGHSKDNDWSKPDVQQIEMDQHHIRKEIRLEGLDKETMRRKREEESRKRWEKLKKRLDRERAKLEHRLADQGIYDTDQWIFDKLERKRLEPPY